MTRKDKRCKDQLISKLKTLPPNAVYYERTKIPNLTSNGSLFTNAGDFGTQKINFIIFYDYASVDLQGVGLDQNGNSFGDETSDADGFWTALYKAFKVKVPTW